MIFILYPQITQADLAEAASAELLCFLSSACEQCFFFKKKVWKSNSHKNSCSYYIKTSPAQWVLSSFLWNRFLKLLNAICPLSRADTLQRLHFWREGVCPLHTPVLEARSSSLAACSREMLLGYWVAMTEINTRIMTHSCFSLLFRYMFAGLWHEQFTQGFQSTPSLCCKEEKRVAFHHIPCRIQANCANRGVWYTDRL